MVDLTQKLTRRGLLKWLGLGAVGAYLSSDSVYTLEQLFSGVSGPAGCIPLTRVLDNKLYDVQKESKEHDIHDHPDYRHLSYEEVIRVVETPFQAHEYIRTHLIPAATPIYVPSFKNIHENREANCLGAVFAASALLSDNGYPSLGLILKGEGIAHILFLYKEGNLFGTVGINSQDFSKPSTVREAVLDLNRKYNEDWIRYAVIDLSKQFPGYIDSDKKYNGAFSDNKDRLCPLKS